MTRLSDERFKQILDELVCENCRDNYCFLKKFITSLRPEADVLMQLKCIEKFKWEESEREGYDIGWNEAGMRWATGGFAEAFREAFDDQLSIRENYDKIMKMMGR